jgi:eukaryotic-like serine/threonine-protein kinase
MFRREVLESLRADSTLSEPVRREALALAENMREDPQRVNQASWSVVRSPGAEPAAYDRASRLAEVACRLSPRNGVYLTTLGVAQYRLGRYREAVESLTRSDRLNAVANNGSAPADLAFLALAQHRLGQTELARATLCRLREAMKKPNWDEDEEAQSLLLEAEAIDLDLIFPADSFAH